VIRGLSSPDRSMSSAVADTVTRLNSARLSTCSSTRRYPLTPIFTIRSYAREDRASLIALLWELPLWYPRGLHWLQARLTDVEHGAASATIAVAHGATVGVIIDTPKAQDRGKLSTLYVAPGSRRRGLAGQLLQIRECSWIEQGLRTVSCTLPWPQGAATYRFLAGYGFTSVALARQRYGPRRDELVVTWQQH